MRIPAWSGFNDKSQFFCILPDRDKVIASFDSDVGDGSNIVLASKHHLRFSAFTFKRSHSCEMRTNSRHHGSRLVMV